MLAEMPRIQVFVEGDQFAVYRSDRMIFKGSKTEVEDFLDHLENQERPQERPNAYFIAGMLTGVALGLVIGFILGMLI